ncbi:copper resistance CopC family protein [Microbacterium radiodurans]|uniref:Copper resistance protein CopC n=1 Tax=Microbacterium radiodurans TaxID=661398 RepID=A0A5J5IV26_9MICO|nr:copper resistance CopC family protein [Microbacterium radiodurans]KAA9087197.1 copper resistance protein CopC [Microbacterium radiodurans]
MSSRAPLSRRHSRLLAALGVVAGLSLIGFAPPAFAHDELLAADPAADARIDALPDELTLTFSGVLIDESGINVVSVTDAAGTELAEGDPQLDGTRVTQQISGESQGEITVRWRVVSSDGHPVSGEYAFVAGDPAAAPDPAESSEPAATPDDESASPALWIGIGAGVVVLVGALAVVVVAASRRRTED